MKRKAAIDRFLTPRRSPACAEMPPRIVMIAIRNTWTRMLFSTPLFSLFRPVLSCTAPIPMVVQIPNTVEMSERVSTASPNQPARNRKMIIRKTLEGEMI